MPTALLSVHDKTGLVEFAQGLTTLGWKLLRENQSPATEVADYTGSPEILGRRAKTLHPAIHGGLLARPAESDRAELLRLSRDYIDLVAVIHRAARCATPSPRRRDGNGGDGGEAFRALKGQCYE